MNANTKLVDFHTELLKCSDYVRDFFAELKINTLIHDHLHRKRSGYSVNYLFLILILLPFYGMNLFDFCKSKRNIVKDTTVFYSFLNNIHNSWRTLILKLAKNFIEYIEYKYKNRCINKKNKFFYEIIVAIDSSSIHRIYSKAVTFLGWLFDHNEDRHYLGYELIPLVCIYCGKFFPIDFIFKSNTKENNILIDKDDNKLCNSASLERREECFKSSPISIVKMVDRAIKCGINIKHIVGDCFYSSKYLIKSFTDRNINYITRLKNGNTNYLYKDQEYTLEDLHKTLKQSTCRPYNDNFDILGYRVVEIPISNKDEGFNDINEKFLIKVKIVFTALHSDHSKWTAFLSNNLSMSIEDMIEIYSERWNIEVFFKITKQTLKINDQYQGQNFDGYISIISILMIQYYLILFYNINSKYESHNEIFKKLSKEIKCYYYDLNSFKLWIGYLDLSETSYKNNLISKDDYIERMNIIKLSINSAIQEGRSEIVESIYTLNILRKIEDNIYELSAA